MSTSGIVFGVLLTFASFVIFPCIKYSIVSHGKKYKKDDIEFVLIINSIIVSLLWFLLSILIYGWYTAISGYAENLISEIATPILYYFINKLIFCRKKRLIPEETVENVEQSKEDNEEIEDDTIEEEVIEKKDTEEASSFMPYHDK